MPFTILFFIEPRNSESERSLENIKCLLTSEGRKLQSEKAACPDGMASDTREPGLDSPQQGVPAALVATGSPLPSSLPSGRPFPVPLPSKIDLAWGSFLLSLIRWLDASPTQWTWVWAYSRRQWRTGKPGVLQSMGLKTAWHDWASDWTTRVNLN